MEHSTKVGISFGLTSGVITTLGLMVGLNAGTHSQLAVVGGILTIAIADAFSDALGIHISEESENKHTTKEIWQSTLATFFSKLLFALTFLVPVLMFRLDVAVLVSIVWGLLVLSVLSYRMAKEQNKKAWNAIAEHMSIAVVVIFATHFTGVWIAAMFA
ncbi:hypothetical protein HQ545_00810 [Candidatus Woesearchaeota archaeon]|nr:hypothetical protein [Candidatus Woesearchaeota archaeon]